MDSEDAGNLFLRNTAAHMRTNLPPYLHNYQLTSVPTGLHALVFQYDLICICIGIRWYINVICYQYIAIWIMQSSDQTER
jgi:hypothetical protein